MFHFGFWICDFGSKGDVTPEPAIFNPKSAIQNPKSPSVDHRQRRLDLAARVIVPFLDGGLDAFAVRPLGRVGIALGLVDETLLVVDVAIAGVEARHAIE